VAARASERAHRLLSPPGTEEAAGLHERGGRRRGVGLDGVTRVCEGGSVGAWQQ